MLFLTDSRQELLSFNHIHIINQMILSGHLSVILFQTGEKEFVKVVFSFQFGGIFSAAICASAHGSIEFFSCCDQIHLVNFISEFPAFGAEGCQWMF